MVKKGDAEKGKRELLNRLRAEFRCPENLHYYSEKDFKRAERKFIKYYLQGAV